MRFKKYALAPNVWIVWFLLDDAGRYDRFTTVTEHEDGKILHVRGWAWPLLKTEEYMALRDQLFPRARQVSWERLDFDSGKFRPAVVHLGPPA